MSESYAPQFFQLLFLVFATALFYFIAIRPHRKQRKQREQMLNELKKGDKIITIGGIYGTIIEVEDDVIIVKVADQLHLKMTRGSVGMVRDK